MNIKTSSFKISKTQIIITLVLFFILYFYLPLIKCVTDLDVSKKVCERYSLCTTDFWFSMFNIVSNYELYENKYYCPEKDFSHLNIIIITLLLLFTSYLIAFSLEKLYIKYRDI